MLSHSDRKFHNEDKHHFKLKIISDEIKIYPSTLLM